jgi:D-amino peptidase
MDEIDPRCRVIRGAGRPGATIMAGLDADCDVVLLVGHHARSGSRPGIMAHTISYGAFRSVSLAGNPIGESEIFAIRAGELGVPVGLVTGDQTVARELLARTPWIETVVVKQALSNQAADVVPPERAREAVYAGAKCAVERAAQGEFSPYLAEPAPYAIEVEMRERIGEDMRKNLATLPEFVVVDEKRITTLAEDMDTGFRRIAYLGFADRPGMTRY